MIITRQEQQQKGVNMKKEYIVQVYDEKGVACKMPRYFEGTEEEVIKYIEERFGGVDLVCGRITKYYETNDEDNIPMKIEV